MSLHPCHKPQIESEHAKSHAVAGNVSDAFSVIAAADEQLDEQWQYAKRNEHNKEKHERLNVCHNFMSLMFPARVMFYLD